MTTTTTTASRAYFFRCFDTTTSARIAGAHSTDSTSLSDAIAQLPPTWLPWEALVERGNQLDRIPATTLENACRAAGKYRS